MHKPYFMITYKILFADGREVPGEPFLAKAADLNRAKEMFNDSNPSTADARYQILDVKSFPSLDDVLAAWALDN